MVFRYRKTQSQLFVDNKKVRLCLVWWAITTALPVILMSLVTLAIVGVLKTPLKVNLKNADKYGQFISVAVMLATIGVITGVVAVYRIYIAKQPFVTVATLKDIGSVFLLTQTFYMMYKKYGRKGLTTLVGRYDVNKVEVFITTRGRKFINTLHYAYLFSLINLVAYCSEVNFLVEKKFTKKQNFLLTRKTRHVIIG